MWIPLQLRIAKWQLRILIIINHTARELPLSAALAGILFVVLGQSGFATYSTWLTITLPLSAIIFVPVVRILTQAPDERIQSIRYVTVRSPQLGFLNLLFDIYCFMRGAQDIVGKIDKISDTDKKALQKFTSLEAKLRKRTALGEPEVLASKLYDLLEFKSEYALFDYLRFQPDRLRAVVKSFLHARRQEINDIQEPADHGNQRILNVDNLRYFLSNQFTEFLLIKNIKLVQTGLIIATMPGTSTAIRRLLFELNELKKREDSEAAKTLAKLVDNSRGTSMIELADLNKWLAAPLSSPVPRFVERDNATNDLANKFETYLDSYIKNHLGKTKFGKSGRKLSIVTGGYSAAVLMCIAKAKDYIGHVYIIQSDGRSRGEDRQMRAALEAEGSIKEWCQSLHRASTFCKITMTDTVPVRVSAKITH